MAQYKYSRDDYYRLTNAPCIDVALALGMEINERASDQKAWKMKDEQGLCIYREGNNWYRFSDGRHGFSIDLVIDKLGCSREQALDFIAKNVVNGVSEQVRLDHKAPANVKKELPKEKIFTVPAHDVKPSRVMAYLIKTRGIDPEIVKGMLQRKMIAEDSAHHNCLFFGRDEKGNIRSCAQRGTTQVQFRGEVSGGDKAYTFAMNGKSIMMNFHMRILSEQTLPVRTLIFSAASNPISSVFPEKMNSTPIPENIFEGIENADADTREKFMNEFLKAAKKKKRSMKRHEFAPSKDIVHIFLIGLGFAAFATLGNFLPTIIESLTNESEVGIELYSTLIEIANHLRPVAILVGSFGTLTTYFCLFRKILFPFN